MNTKIFCLPYAGGSATIYRGWHNYLDPSIKLIPIELSGRGERIAEPLYDTLDMALDDVLSIIREDIDTAPYALFGHSMGAMLSYELAQRIVQEGLPKPQHLFFSGRGVPDVTPIKKKKYHLMDDKEFEKELMLLGGTPVEIFENRELRHLFFPLLRSDFNLSGTDLSKRKVTPFDCDLSILVGKEEKLSAKRITGWKRHTKGICNVHFLTGGHFFLKHEQKTIADIINQRLAKTAKERHPITY